MNSSINKWIQRYLRVWITLSVIVGINTSCAHAESNPPPHEPAYPKEWWAYLSPDEAPDWEKNHLPQSAAYGEVILSKRTELGALSNFAATPFKYKGRTYASMEGFWQATKYPENKNDPRAKFPGIEWPFTRTEVEAMIAHDAKHAGDAASRNMKKMGINWVSFNGRRMLYRQPGNSEFYRLIVAAMKAKLEQNDDVKKILLQTDSLILRPDHQPEPPQLKAWQYFDIWMDFRKELLKSGK